MSFKEFFQIVGEIFQNWYVIATLIAMLLVIAFTNFIVKYRRKPKKAKKKTISAPKPAPQETPVPESDSTADLPSDAGEA